MGKYSILIVLSVLWAVSVQASDPGTNAVRDRHAVGPNITNAIRDRHAVGPNITNAIRDRHAVGSMQSARHAALLDLNQK